MIINEFWTAFAGSGLALFVFCAIILGVNTLAERSKPKSPPPGPRR